MITSRSSMRQGERPAPVRGADGRPRAFEGNRPMTGKFPSTPSRATSPVPVFRPSPVIGSMKKGGKVKKTGTYKLHKGEQVVPLSSLRGK